MIPLYELFLIRAIVMLTGKDSLGSAMTPHVASCQDTSCGVVTKAYLPKQTRLIPSSADCGKFGSFWIIFLNSSCMWPLSEFYMGQKPAFRIKLSQQHFDNTMFTLIIIDAVEF
jgi:hypothetical protein